VPVRITGIKVSRIRRFTHAVARDAIATATAKREKACAAEWIAGVNMAERPVMKVTAKTVTVDFRQASDIPTSPVVGWPKKTEIVSPDLVQMIRG
jgi:hypothetical protein